ncbi:hypothetical protein BC835DRAFT_1277026 [Cytidiella melzeri]|nr:hypothetical protein BC835DRAFT_1277026 [Cytidiella melzeri]
MSSLDLHHHPEAEAEAEAAAEAQQCSDLYSRLETQPHADYFSASPHITFDDVQDDEDDDIYRGEPPPEPPSPPRTPRPPSVVSNSSSSPSRSISSSDSSVFGGRLGAISTIVERAISHWARAWVSTSSLSDSSPSSSSSRPSIVTASRSVPSKRRRRRPSVADIHNAKSEWEVHAKIRAREEARQVPREFLLYSPRLAESSSQRAKASVRLVDVGSEPRGVLRTTALPAILQELSRSMKTTARSRRLQENSTPPPDSQVVSTVRAGGTSDGLRYRDFVLPVEPSSDYRPVELEDARMRRRGRKGKNRSDVPVVIPTAPQVTRDPSDSDVDKAWWLDVASPTWEDMRAIGKLLHLHPLTLEDILMQEPREKLELFPKLGYYLVVFRAIESEKSRNRRRLMGTQTGQEGRGELRDEGFLEGVNVYLVVFKEGICSFHFSDISEHADAVRNKILSLAESATITIADWIAHGIMDSIVDSFFPVLEQVEKEMLHLETVMFSDEIQVTQSPNAAKEQGQEEPLANQCSDPSTVVSPSSSFDKDEKKLTSEKVTTSALRTQFVIPRSRILSLRYTKDVFRRFSSVVPRFNVKVNQAQRGEHATHNTVLRIALVRRLVTSLSRILATKSEVVAQVKKRLLMAGETGLAHGTGGDHDVYVYLGDVQDHILTLQQSLAHYERMLSHSHPTYLAHLRLSASKSKSGSDKAIALLSILSMAVLVMQVVLGINSMNVKLLRGKPGTFHVFGTVVSIAVFVLCMYGCLVRWWWVSARKRSWA